MPTPINPRPPKWELDPRHAAIWIAGILGGVIFFGALGYGTWKLWKMLSAKAEITQRMSAPIKPVALAGKHAFRIRGPG